MLNNSIQTGYSWVILFIFSINLTTLGLQTYTLSSIAPAIGSIYSVEEIYIEMCSFIFFINYPLFLVPAYYFDDYFDSRKSVIVGSLLSFIGSCLRIGCIQSFWWIVAGSFVSSISQPFLLNQVTKLSVLWFKSEKRARATSISMVFFMLGGGGSYAVSGSMINESSGKQDVFYLMILEALLCLISLFLISAFFKDKRSDTASFLLLMKKVDIKSDLIQVLKNKNFMLLFFSTIISCGNANFFAVTIAFITEYYDVGAPETSLLGTICTISGLASCLITGYISSLIGKYKKICLATMSLSVPCYLFFFLVQKFDILIISMIMACLLGTNIMPIYSLGLEMACEIAFPVREIITSGLINCFTQLYGLIPIFIAYLFGNSAVFIVGLLVFQQILSVVLMILTKETLKRKDMESMSFAMEKSNIDVKI